MKAGHPIAHLPPFIGWSCLESPCQRVLRRPGPTSESWALVENASKKLHSQQILHTNPRLSLCFPQGFHGSRGSRPGLYSRLQVFGARPCLPPSTTMHMPFFDFRSEPRSRRTFQYPASSSGTRLTVEMQPATRLAGSAGLRVSLSPMRRDFPTLAF